MRANLDLCLSEMDRTIHVFLYPGEENYASRIAELERGKTDVRVINFPVGLEPLHQRYDSIMEQVSIIGKQYSEGENVFHYIYSDDEQVPLLAHITSMRRHMRG